MGVRLTLGDVSDERVALRCSCSEAIAKSRDGEIVFKNKVITLSRGKVYAVCRKCSSRVQLPLVPVEKSTTDDDAQTPATGGPRLYLEK